MRDASPLQPWHFEMQLPTNRQRMRDEQLLMISCDPSQYGMDLKGCQCRGAL
jgi:hypothetical protein